MNQLLPKIQRATARLARHRLLVIVLMGLLPMVASVGAFAAQMLLQMEPPEVLRSPVIAQLRQGRRLVIVHYRPQHDIHREWVQNAADIDNSAIVWAREMNSAADSELIRYFRGRTVWRLNADPKPPRLILEKAVGWASANSHDATHLGSDTFFWPFSCPPKPWRRWMPKMGCLTPIALLRNAPMNQSPNGLRRLHPQSNTNAEDRCIKPSPTAFHRLMRVSDLSR